MLCYVKGELTLITKADVQKAADLARLELSAEEVEHFQSDLSEILAAARKLQDVPTDGVEPMAHATPLVNVTRLDNPKEGLSVADALQNGPHVVKGFFRVPRILGSGEEE